MSLELNKTLNKSTQYFIFIHKAKKKQTSFNGEMSKKNLFCTQFKHAGLPLCLLTTF